MLVLTRKVNESIRIGDDIVVTVTQIGGKKVRLAITAPRDVAILRSEIRRDRANMDAPSLATGIPTAIALSQVGLEEVVLAATQTALDQAG